MISHDGWIGVDLDRTLAFYDEWRGVDHIGDPIPLMEFRVKKWIKDGKRVKIFTARAARADGVAPVKAWLKKYGFGDLEVTNVKDLDMYQLWDDRAVQVVENRGVSVKEAAYLFFDSVPG